MQISEKISEVGLLQQETLDQILDAFDERIVKVRINLSRCGFDFSSNSMSPLYQTSNMNGNLTDEVSKQLHLLNTLEMHRSFLELKGLDEIIFDLQCIRTYMISVESKHNSQFSAIIAVYKHFPYLRYYLEIICKVWGLNNATMFANAIEFADGQKELVVK